MLANGWAITLSPPVVEPHPALGDVPYAVVMEPNLVVEYYAKN